jgi:hypothetical protein
LSKRTALEIDLLRPSRKLWIPARSILLPVINDFAELLKAVVLGIFSYKKFFVFFWPLALFIG